MAPIELPNFDYTLTDYKDTGLQDSMQSYPGSFSVDPFHRRLRQSDSFFYRPAPSARRLRCHRLHRLRIREQFRRIEHRLQLLQFCKTLPIVRWTRSRPVQPRISIVDVHTPVVSGQRRCDVGDPTVEEAEAVGRVRAEEVAVVELDEVQLVSVRVRGGAEVAVGDG